MIIDNIAAYAVGRSHNIVGLPIGKSRVEADPQVVIGQRDRDAGGAALPNSHQPNAVESKISNLIPVAVGTVPRSIALPSVLLIASSQGQVLIS
jgi:hypothetical protein